MTGDVLAEAYQRLHRTGPEFGGENWLTNHGPMAVEALVRRGHAEEVGGWVDRYVRRLEDLPSASDPVTHDTWREALGDARRIGDWTAYLTAEVAERPWREVLVTWWPRLLPGIVAGATHGVIRTGHAVRTLLGGGEGPQAVTELAHALAYWAARSVLVPGVVPPSGDLEVADALAAVPRIPRQEGTIASRLGQLAEMPDWSPSLAALTAPAGPEQTRSQLADLVDAATLRYLTYGHGQRVLLVHAATAPNAVLHTLPALPETLWAQSLTAAWATAAAITSWYTPEPQPRDTLPAGSTDVDAVFARAVEHGDEHVIKFADTAVESFARTGNPDMLAAATRAADLI
ncbi:questin oxidase family protein [Actinocrispum wychmicini]|uniref:Uncharacterized protein DUF4243 n=1 Tax=Actinocrispum wychmicini TaxID=1213861 RepID=A0A4R2JQ70_9PSEU|nr:questin oxidase family protein [Actinocrispum wychmicini]TCO60932.1 uncharacterized protein DUF4243 [Actinocrispum wychmicini]